MPTKHAADAVIMRSIGVVALLGIAAMHFLQIVETFQETPLLGLGYVALISASVVAAGWLIVVDDTRAWAAAGLISFAVIVGYTVTRLVGTTFDNQDVGNWSCVLGLASLFVEATLLALSSLAIGLSRARVETPDVRHALRHCSVEPATSTGRRSP